MISDAGALTLFHITHWKAGSTWINAILSRCAPELIVPAKPKRAHFLDDPIQEGKVYPRVYVTREEFEAVKPPGPWTRFVVIRDLRDTVVSAYFSIKFSHSVSQFPNVREGREQLRKLSFKEGLARTMELEVVAKSAAIQRSWLGAGEPLIRYEDLLHNDAEILERVLIDECGFQVEPQRLRAAVHQSRFAAMSGGRLTGLEDHTAHQRKGVAGDWRNYLRGSLKESFKRHWGELLIATGYEKDLNW